MNKIEIKKIMLAVMQCLAQDLLSNKITQKEYQTEVTKIVNWADKAFAELN
jgi:hypothetical protein